MEIIVVARFRVVEGKELEVEVAFREAIPPTHLEDGCILYGLHRGSDDPRTLMMIERWSTREALNAHLRSEHVQKLFVALDGLVEGTAEITVLEPRSEDLGPKGRIS